MRPEMGIGEVQRLSVMVSMVISVLSALAERSSEKVHGALGLLLAALVCRISAVKMWRGGVEETMEDKDEGNRDGRCWRRKAWMVAISVWTLVELDLV